METSITLSATKRTGSGKGPARRLRAAGKLPAIVYGPAQSARAISVDPKDVSKILHAPLGRNTVVTLNVDGQNELALLKSFEYHPVTRDFEHADFYTVKVDRPILVEIPLHTTGKAVGVAVGGGILRVVYRKVLVKCTPDKIPAKIEIDVTRLELGHALHAKDLPLPAGVTVMLDPQQTVVSVVAPEKEEKVEAAAGAAAPAAAAAAAPAKDAKAAAPAKDAKAAAPAKDAKAAAPAKDAKKK